MVVTNFTDMKTLLICRNPFDLKSEASQHTSILSKTINQWLNETGCEGGVLDGRPLVCSVNAVPTLRKDWDTPLAEDDVVVVFPVVEDPINIIIAVVVLVVSVVVSVALSSAQRSIPDVNSTGDVKEADPVFTLRGQQNKNKLSNPIEKIYGQVRHWPSYAAAPYTRFINNDQYLYQLFCLGHGKVRIDQLYIEDTPIEQFSFIEYEVVEPGGTVTLFPDNVFSSTEVSGIELFGSNEASYSGYAGGFVVCPPLSMTKIIEVDFTLTKGLYYSNDAGGLDPLTVTADVQARLIDDANTPAGAWTTVLTFSKTMNTNVPQRFTLRIEVPEGRYEVRAVRTNVADTSYRASDTLSWEALRAYLPSVSVYPGVTMLVVNAKATNNLNDNASNRINFTGVGRTPVWSPDTGWVDNVVNRSPVWAVCDIFRASYGGNLPSEFLDLPALHQLDLDLASEGIFFDWVFEQKTTTWEAAKAVALIARCVPMLSGSKITLLRDVPQVMPKMLFNENNIVQGSLTVDIKLRDVQDNDGYEVSYTNSTSWQAETVLCLGPGDEGNNLKQVNVPGCTDRVRAFRIGMYMRLSQLLVRSNITFKTGMEGLMITYGDLIAINHKFPRWGAGGYVVNITDSGYIVTLSEAVTFTPGQTHFLLMRRKDGSVFGPSAVTQISSNQVQLSNPVDVSTFCLIGGEPPIYLFGYGTSWGKLGKVSNMQPQGDEEVTITCVNYAPGIYASDTAEPPAYNAGFFLPKLSGTPSVTDLQVGAHPTNEGMVILTWRGSIGASRYTIDTSTDGVTFSTYATTPSSFYLLPVFPGHLWIRVYAVSTGAGAPAEWDGMVGATLSLPGNVAGLALTDWSGFILQVSWTALSGTFDNYVVRVFARPAGGAYKLVRTRRTIATSFSYSLSQAQSDGTVGREIKIIVTGSNVTGESAVPAVLEVVNAAPSAATGFSLVAGTMSWTGDTNPDVEFYRVIASRTSGDLTGRTVYEGKEQSHYNTIAFLGYTYDEYMAGLYMTVLTKDVWGPELVPSAEIHIP